MVPNSLGPGELLLHYGTDEQKNYYLPRLAKGLEVPCFALTNPEAGSDAAAIPDRAVVCKGVWQGKEVLGMRVTWDKRYITLGPVATLLGLAFRLYDPEKLISDKEDLGITCALVPTNTPGVNIGRRHLPLNAAFQNWMRPDTTESVVCDVNIKQIPGGEVLSANVVEPCRTDALTKQSIEAAILRAQPLPYKGFESVFRREIIFTFCFPKEACPQ
jgi:alkylation response protein AidB-like acyl-CoA dehydrogenase